MPAIYQKVQNAKWIIWSESFYSTEFVQGIGIGEDNQEAFLIWSKILQDSNAWCYTLVCADQIHHPDARFALDKQRQALHIITYHYAW